MKIVFTLITFLFLSCLTAQTTVDFDSITIDSFLNGSTADGSFEVGDVRLPNNYNPMFESWTGWALSAETDTLTPGFTNQYSSIAGGGAGGSANYAVSFGASNVLHLAEEAQGSVIESIRLTNTTYAALSMRDGDSFAKKFGGVTGDDPDFFLLTIKGYRDSTIIADSVDFYLADYRFTDNSQDYIITDWTTLDLTGIGPVDSLQFTLVSSDVGRFGNNTPSYFAADNIALARSTGVSDATRRIDINVFPNPTADFVTLAAPAGVTDAAVALYDLTGRRLLTTTLLRTGRTIDLRSLPTGQYILHLRNGHGVATRVIARQ